jgi:phosphopantetheine adenylyltransferase
MAKKPTPKPEVKKPNKAKAKPKAPEWEAKGKTTATGKKAADINIRPNIKIMDYHGRPIHESTAVVVWGRMNPPTIGHEFLVSEAHRIAEEAGGVPLLFLSKTVGKNNPLTLSERYDLVQEAFGDQIFVVDENLSNPIDLFKYVAEAFGNIIVVTGVDQKADYDRILKDYNGKDFTFEQATTFGCNRSDDSTNITESVSATKLRQAVTENDIATFSRGLPSKIKYRTVEIFEQVKLGLNLYSSTPKTLQERAINEMAKVRQSH